MTPNAAKLRELLPDPDETTRMKTRGSKEAAVLVPIYPLADRLIAVFTVRRTDLRKHAGEISFPGGRPHAGEQDLYKTALRETEEEIGLPPDQVELVGGLPPTPTLVTNYAIYPFVGLIKPLRPWKPNPFEVEEVLELALVDLLNGYERKRLVRRGVPIKTATYTVGEHLVWGATARVLGSLLSRIKPLLDEPSS